MDFNNRHRSKLGIKGPRDRFSEGLRGESGRSHPSSDLEKKFPRHADETLLRSSLKTRRRQFQEDLRDLIRHNFPRLSIHKWTCHSNLTYPLSGKYVRVIFESGSNQWHAVAMGPHESQTDIDGLLSQSLLWREYLRERYHRTPDKLILMAPAGRTLVLKSRLPWIRGAGRALLLMEMDLERSSLEFVDLADSGNLDTFLTRVDHSSRLSTKIPYQSSSGPSELLLQQEILRDISIIDPSLDGRFVYPQVPAFLAGDRGMIDILTLTKRGRLAILELKVSEDIELPVQGLDYWLRVRWHHERAEFQQKGYFPGLELSSLPPILYFVCPQFRYHDSFSKITRYLDPEVPIWQVGINENWKEGIKVVRKQFLHGGLSDMLSFRK